VPDHLIRGLLDPKAARVVAAWTTDIARIATARHELSGVAPVALGRALTAGLLLATLTKGEERVSLLIAGDGPLARLAVDANGAGQVRGYVSPRVVVPLPPQRPPVIARAIGRGTVTVVRDLGLREQYRGSAAIVTGEVDEDVEAYLRQSEQLDSALGCEVVVDASGAVVAAGGLLLQALPGGEPALVRELQHALRTGELYRAIEHIAARPDESDTAAQAIVQALLSTESVRVLDQRPVCFRCTCSADRARELAGMLDAADLTELLANQQGAEITCSFCSQRYTVDQDTLRQIHEYAAMRPRERN
jgi:molecular chaperone Hsp33